MIYYPRRLAFSVAARFREALLLLQLVIPPRRQDVLVIPVTLSMTTFPARVNRAWIAIETLLRQTVRPERFLLVLNTEEFPDKKIPRRIQRQTKRGLQILWVEKNGKSFDKLLPSIKAFPDYPTITVDDDKFFPPDLLALLWARHLAHPANIVGARGWAIKSGVDGSIRFGANWVRVNSPSVGRYFHLPGGNGVLYPPGSLDSRVKEISAALEICPTTDDIWFWAAAMSRGTRFTVLSLPAHRNVRAMRSTPALNTVNARNEDIQFQNAINFFGLTDFLDQA